MTKVWYKDNKVRETVIEMKLSGLPLKEISDFIVSKGYKCKIPNLSVYFKQQGIKTTNKLAKGLVSEEADITALKKAKKTINLEMNRLAKQMKKNTQPNMKMATDYLKLTEAFRKLTEATKTLGKVRSKAEQQLIRLNKIILEAEDNGFEGITDYVSKKLLGGE